MQNFIIIFNFTLSHYFYVFSEINLFLNIYSLLFNNM